MLIVIGNEVQAPQVIGFTYTQINILGMVLTASRQPVEECKWGISLLNRDPLL